MQVFHTLYYHDSNGRLRTWRAEADGARYRVVTGLDDGKKVESKWKATKAKNVGKKNATTAEEQALAEVRALYVLNEKKGWHQDPAKISKPFIEPMLAAIYQKQKALDFKTLTFAQPKLDGFRCVITRDGVLKSRDGELFWNVAHIAQALETFFEKHPEVEALDGELYNHEYKDDFNKISSMLRRQTVTEEFAQQCREKVQFHCYDVIFKDLTIPFQDRTTFIQRYLPNIYCLVTVKTHIVESDQAVHAAKAMFDEDGYEGAIIRLNGPYEFGKRSKFLLKYKGKDDAEFEIVELLEGQGNWSGAVKHVIIKLEDGSTQKAGTRGTMEMLQDLLAQKEVWPGRIVTVEYEGRTPDGKLRFPVVTKYHAPNGPEKRKAKK